LRLPRKDKQRFTGYQYSPNKFPKIHENYGAIIDVYDNRGKIKERFPQGTSLDDITRFVKSKHNRDIDFLGII